MIELRNFAGEVRQKWFEPSADYPGGMVSATFDLTVVVEILFKRALGRLHRSDVSSIALRPIQKSVPRFSKCEWRREKALRENLNGEAAGELLRLLGCGDPGLHG